MGEGERPASAVGVVYSWLFDVQFEQGLFGVRERALCRQGGRDYNHPLSFFLFFGSVTVLGLDSGSTFSFVQQRYN